MPETNVIHRGFRLAGSPQYNYVLAGLVLFVFPVMVLILLTKKFVQKRWKKTQAGAGDQQGGYKMEPWRQTEPQPGNRPDITVTTSQNEHAHLVNAQPDMKSYPHYQQDKAMRGELGPQQVARDYV